MSAKIEPETLTYVSVGGVIYGGELVSANPLPDYPDYVEILIVDNDPSCGKMSVIGPMAGEII